MSDRVQSIERAIDVLLALVDGPKTLAQVTRATGLNKGTAFRILASLGYENLIVKGDDNAYMLGPGCLRLVQAVLAGYGAISVVGRSALTELWEATAETVSIHVRLGTERVCIEEMPSPEGIRYISTVGSSAPLQVGCAGRILLAFAPPAEREAALEALMAAGHTIDAPTLRHELELAVERGYAMSAGERVHGASAISVPIRGRHGFVASLSILGPDSRMTEARRLSYLPAMREAAGAIETALNYGSPTRDEQILEGMQ